MNLSFSPGFSQVPQLALILPTVSTVSSAAVTKTFETVHEYNDAPSPIRLKPDVYERRS